MKGSEMKLRKSVYYLPILLLLAGSLFAQRRGKQTMVEGHNMTSLLNPGDIPAIFEPEFISVKEAEKLYYGDEPLIAVTDGDKAKAYSIWHLDRHEIVNDYINGKAITVTW